MGLTKAGLNSGVVLISSGRNSGILLYVASTCGKAKKGFLITKTYLHNFDPLKPHFYIVKLGFTGEYIIFLISNQKHGLWVLVRTASPRRIERVPQSMF